MSSTWFNIPESSASVSNFTCPCTFEKVKLIRISETPKVKVYRVTPVPSTNKEVIPLNWVMRRIGEQLGGIEQLPPCEYLLRVQCKYRLSRVHVGTIGERGSLSYSSTTLPSSIHTSIRCVPIGAANNSLAAAGACVRIVTGRFMPLGSSRVLDFKVRPINLVDLVE